MSGLLVGCGGEGIPVRPTPVGTYPVAPIFRDVYKYLGGEKYLGPAISPEISEDGLTIQYLEAGRLEYDPNASESERIRFSPLGRTTVTPENPVPEPGGVRYVNGHIIYTGFVDLYDQLGGARFAGLPITEMRFNAEEQRLEQYFENLAFYRLESDPPGLVKLLPLGVIACNLDCRYPNAINVNESPVRLTGVFAIGVDKLKSNFLGRYLLGPVKWEGRQIVIFENAVLSESPLSTQRPFGLPIVELVGIPAEPPTANNRDPRMIFYPIEGNQGFNVPLIFDEYSAQHGGLDFSGVPITEVKQIEAGIYRQCYKNICLEYHVNAPDGLKIRPAHLGLLFRDRFFPSSDRPAPPIQEAPAKITLKVAEASPILTSETAQTIFVNLFEDTTPLAMLEPVLILTLPDSSQIRVKFPPTGIDGKTSLTIAPIQAPNGTAIPYQVCLENYRVEAICVADSFVLWANK